LIPSIFNPVYFYLKANLNKAVGCSDGGKSTASLTKKNGTDVEPPYERYLRMKKQTQGFENGTIVAEKGSYNNDCHQQPDKRVGNTDNQNQAKAALPRQEEGGEDTEGKKRIASLSAPRGVRKKDDDDDVQNDDNDGRAKKSKKDRYGNGKFRLWCRTSNCSSIFTRRFYCMGMRTHFLHRLI
jgi:hypothetical protein